MKSALVIALLALAFDFAAAGQQPSQRVAESMHTLQTIDHVLVVARASATLEYKGDCSSNPGVALPDLPPSREPQKPYSKNPVDTLRSMFSGDRSIEVYQEKSGIIRVVEAGVQTDILHVRIKHLSFDGIPDVKRAFFDVALGAPEVHAFMQTHGIVRYEPFFMADSPST